MQAQPARGGWGHPHCYSTAPVDHLGLTTGGLVAGLVGENAGLVDGCWSSSIVTSVGSDVGGLIGSNTSTGTALLSFAAGKVDAAGSRVGGLVGNHAGAASQSWASGAVSGSAQVGGLVGTAAGSVTDSYAWGAVAANPGGEAGGLAGELTAGASLTRAYSTGTVSASITPEGSFVGENTGGTLNACYFDNTVNAGLDAVGNDPSATGVVGVDDTAITEQATFSGWDFTTVWQIDEGNAPPTLRWGGGS